MSHYEILKTTKLKDIQHNNTTYGVIRELDAGSNLKFWLIHNGFPCAFARCNYEPEEDEFQLILGDVEVHPDYRGTGLCTVLLTVIKESTGLTLYSFGDRTELGHKALAGKLPLVEGYVEEVCHNPIKFVSSWEKMDTYY